MSFCLSASSETHTSSLFLSLLALSSLSISLTKSETLFYLSLLAPTTYIHTYSGGRQEHFQIGATGTVGASALQAKEGSGCRLTREPLMLRSGFFFEHSEIHGMNALRIDLAILPSRGNGRRPIKSFRLCNREIRHIVDRTGRVGELCEITGNKNIPEMTENDACAAGARGSNSGHGLPSEDHASTWRCG